MQRALLRASPLSARLPATPAGNVLRVALRPAQARRAAGSEPVSWNPQSGYKYGTPPVNRTGTESWEYVWYPYLAFLTAVLVAKVFFYPTQDPLKKVEAETIQRLKDEGRYPTYDPIRGGQDGQVPKGMPSNPLYS